jgi:hypothetical protein
MLNWAENYGSVIELYQSADHPALSPETRHLLWLVFTAYFLGGFYSTTWKTLHQNSLGLAHFHNGYSFLMISPNLHDIWPLFLLIPSRY